MQTGRTDANQPDIVKALRKLPGITVETSHDDIIVGYKGVNYWYEIKEPRHVSNQTGELRPSCIKPSQYKLLDSWKGHYKIVWNVDQILEDMMYYL